MIHVFLDDVRPCPKGFVPARTVEECILLLQECEVHVLSLDYDLGWDQPNGYELARYMVQHRLFAKEIYLHSSSPTGRMNMYQLLYSHKPEHVKLYNRPVPRELLDRIGRESQKS